jgi:hypothetical protein
MTSVPIPQSLPEHRWPPPVPSRTTLMWSGSADKSRAPPVAVGWPVAGPAMASVAMMRLTALVNDPRIP